MKKIFLIIFVIITIAVIFFFKNNILIIKYEDLSIPGGDCFVFLEYTSKTLFVQERRYCSAVDCENTVSTTRNKLLLNETEISKIKKITSKSNYDKRELSNALSSLVEGDKEISNSANSNWYYMEEYDYNKDGISTYREFGNGYLDSILFYQK